MNRLQSFSRHLTSAASVSANQVCLVVGAGDATGGAVARRFAREGFTTCVVRRNKNQLETLVNQIEQEGGKAIPFGCDCRDEEQVINLVGEIEQNIGPIRVAVHNIGANIRYSILETTTRKYEKVWEMAAKSAFLVGREVAKVMVPRKEGTIIFTGATASVRGKEYFAAFSGAKHAKRALASSMFRELAPMGIHVAHVIVDGPIDTEFIRGLFGKEQSDAMRASESLLNPDHIAENYWFLHSQPKTSWTFEMDIRPWDQAVSY